MLFISHRGNLNGPNPKTENTLKQIDMALDKGFDVEVDVWYQHGQLYLGHDGPQERLPVEYITDTHKLWLHCKNVQALLYLNHFDKVKYFWHDKDKYTLTSNGKIWAYPGEELVPGAIAVLPEVKLSGNVFTLSSCHAICTDFPEHYRTLYNSYRLQYNSITT